MSSSSLIECKNNKSSENFEVNEPFLRISEQIIAEMQSKTLEEAINLLVGKLNYNDLCSHRLKVLGLSPDYFNGIIDFGGANTLVKLAEALKEASISSIAEEIANRSNVRIVLIAGPSSSGKTTFCKKLSYALNQQGLNTQSISLDDYYLPHDQVPLDEFGEIDFETIHALDIPLFQQQLSALIAGEEIEVPRYEFAKGRAPHGTKLKLGDDTILLLEGIHGLNPLLTQSAEEGKSLDPSQFFKIYISALTLQPIFNNASDWQESNIQVFPSTDNRLLRRIIRDFNFRNTSATETIAQWDSVRRGEEKWIVPFQQYADVNINSAYQYEVSLLKQQAIPILNNVREEEPEYRTAQRLISVCNFYHEMQTDILPPYSLLREFLGGSKYVY